MEGPEHPAQWSPRGLLLDPEGKEELTAPGIPASTGRGRAARVHFLWLLSQITTNLVAKSNADVFS